MKHPYYGDCEVLTTLGGSISMFPEEDDNLYAMNTESRDHEIQQTISDDEDVATNHEKTMIDDYVIPQKQVSMTHTSTIQQTLTDDELAICHAFGNSPEDYQKQLEEDRTTAMNAESREHEFQQTISDDEIVICQAFGVSPEDYQRQLEADRDTAMNTESVVVSSDEIAQIMGIDINAK